MFSASISSLTFFRFHRSFLLNLDLPQGALGAAEEGAAASASAKVLLVFFVRVLASTREDAQGLGFEKEESENG